RRGRQKSAAVERAPLVPERPDLAPEMASVQHRSRRMPKSARRLQANRTVSRLSYRRNRQSTIALTPRQSVGQNFSEDGANAPTQRVVRATEDRSLAESDHASVPGKSRGGARVRPRSARGLVHVQAAVGHPPSSLHQNQTPFRLRAFFSR